MATEKRLIDANSRIEEIKKTHCTNCENYGGVKCRACWVDDAIGLIDDAPTVDAVEVVHGQNVSPMHPVDEFQCSKCGLILRDWSEVKIDEDELDEQYYEFEFKYCPNCGAKMDGERRTDHA